MLRLICRGVQASAARVARVFQHGQPELDLGVGRARPARPRSSASCGSSKSRALSPQSSALAISAIAASRARREAVVRHPQQRAGALGIERRQRRTVAAVHVATRRLGELLAHERQHRIDLRHRRLDDGRRRLGGLLHGDRLLGFSGRLRARRHHRRQDQGKRRGADAEGRLQHWVNSPEGEQS